jgi:2-deoxy-D-gluconate 3-dehydrogenase
MKMFDLSGKVAVLTGGNGGIGLGIALGLAEAGATIVIAARNPEKNTAAVAEVEAKGAKALAVPTDIRKPEACRALIDRTVAAFGRVDILVNNSGISYRKLPEDYTLEEWHDVIDTNLTAAFVLSQAVYPHLVKQGGGKIISVGSISGFLAGKMQVAYAPSKAAIAQLMRALAVAWAKDNIQCNTIAPGWIDTPLSQGARKVYQGLNEMVTSKTPAGRWGLPEDFAGAAVYLASPAASYVTGTTLIIDGGISSTM